MNFKEELKVLQDFLSKMSDENSSDDTILVSEEDLDELSSELDNMYYKVELGYTSKDGRLLNYNYESDSGFDLFSSEQITLEPFGRALIPTGISFDIPEGFEIQIRSKSGLAINQGLMVLNSPGTVDQGYTGEILVIVFNTNNHRVVIEKGMKVAQAVLNGVVSGKFVDLKKINSVDTKERGDNGFGSTGI